MIHLDIYKNIFRMLLCNSHVLIQQLMEPAGKTNSTKTIIN